MQAYQKEFVQFLLESNALQFGDFLTKSGRNTPFFINLGNLNSGRELDRLGQFYAHAVMQHFGEDVSVLFGPAYKGIPIATSTAIALSRLYGKEVRFCSNRKEVKEHGDAGILLGDKLSRPEKVVLVEDVTTAGTSIYETMDLLKNYPVQVMGLVVSVNRQERGKTDLSALNELSGTFGIKTCAIVTMWEIVEELSNSVITPELKAKIDAYYRQYGAAR